MTFCGVQTRVIGKGGVSLLTTWTTFSVLWCLHFCWVGIPFPFICKYLCYSFQFTLIIINTSLQKSCKWIWISQIFSELAQNFDAIFNPDWSHYHLKNLFIIFLQVKYDKDEFIINSRSNPNGFYWGRQCSWTLKSANSSLTTAKGSNQVQLMVRICCQGVIELHICRL